MLGVETYKFTVDEGLNLFEFVSVGPKGKIQKLIRFSRTEIAGIYNLGFGDKKGETNEIDDTVISNNGDSLKVLATVVSAVYAFTEQNPNAWIFAAGSSPARTRLYRMGISNNLESALLDFEVYGLTAEGWTKFAKGIAFKAFLATRRR